MADFLDRIIKKIKHRFKIRNLNKISKEKEVKIRIDNSDIYTIFGICVDWLEMFQSKIIEKREPKYIKAIHKIDAITTTPSASQDGKIIHLKDIPKILEFNLSRYAGIDTIVSLKIMIDTSRRDVKWFDFTELVWYEEELLDMFRGYEVHLLDN